MVSAVAVLADALAKGGSIVWDPPERPRLFAPPSLHEALKADGPAIREILRRGAILREQAQTPGPWPILALPEHPGGGGCISCGDPVDARSFRCSLCALAVALALGA